MRELAKIVTWMEMNAQLLASGSVVGVLLAAYFGQRQMMVVAGLSAVVCLSVMVWRNDRNNRRVD
jgi:uncharacterized membrane protein YoaK (UPF0700 family)